MDLKELETMDEAKIKRLAYRYTKLCLDKKRSFRNAVEQNEKWYDNRYTLDGLLAFARAIGLDYWQNIFDDLNDYSGEEILEYIKKHAPQRELEGGLEQYLQKLDEEWNLSEALEKVQMAIIGGFVEFPVLFFKCERCGDLFASADNEEVELCSYCKSH